VSTESTGGTAGIRLQKFLADSGVASRRASEELITQGRVAVNGTIQSKLGSRVQPAVDRVTVDGRPVKPRRKIYLALNKPRGFLCSRLDPESRDLITDLLPKEWRSLHSVGRLDCESEGLIFLTNDGEFTLRLTHPRYGVRKLYRVTVDGRFNTDHVEAMKKGIEHDGDWLRAQSVQVPHLSTQHSILEIELTEGKNREIRRMMEHLGYTITQLQRVRIGPIRLGELPVGKWRVLSDAEVKSLLRTKD